MSDDLIERLLQTDKTKHGYYGYVPYNRDGKEAADRIAALETELAALAAKYNATEEADWEGKVDVATPPAGPAPDPVAKALADLLPQEAERANVQRVEHCWPERCYILRWGPFASREKADACLAALRAITEGAAHE